MADYAPQLVSPTELKSWQDEGRSVLVLDVLSSDRFETRHVEGAVQACVFEVSFLDQVHQMGVGKDDTIVVYGSSDGSIDAVTASEKLHKAGYHNTHVMDGEFFSLAEPGTASDRGGPSGER